MENKTREASRDIGKSVEKAAETMGDTVIAVLDRLAGKKSDLKLSFDDLTFDMGMLKATMNGSVTLDIVYATDVSQPTP